MNAATNVAFLDLFIVGSGVFALGVGTGKTSSFSPQPEVGLEELAEELELHFLFRFIRCSVICFLCQSIGCKSKYFSILEDVTVYFPNMLTLFY